MRFYIRKSRLAAGLVLGLNLMTAQAAVLSNDSILSRFRTGVITFNDLTFSNAIELSSSTLQFSGAIGDSGSFSNSQKAGGYDYSMNSGSGMSLFSVIAPSADNGYRGAFTATMVNSIDDSVSFSIKNPVGTVNQGFNYSTLVRDNSSGFNTLEYRGGGFGFVKNGGLYTLDMFIDGNWSNQGNGIGQTQFIGIASGWGITKNFVYNALTNQTEFQAINSSYVLGTSPSLNFILHGTASPVPVPSAIWLFSSALFGIRMFRKRRVSTNDIN